MYLTDARLREAGARENAELTFYPNGGKMFGVPEYHDAIVKQFEARDIRITSYNVCYTKLLRQVLKQK